MTRPAHFRGLQARSRVHGADRPDPAGAAHYPGPGLVLAAPTLDVWPAGA